MFGHVGQVESKASIVVLYVAFKIFTLIDFICIYACQLGSRCGRERSILVVKTRTPLGKKKSQAASRLNNFDDLRRIGYN